MSPHSGADGMQPESRPLRPCLNAESPDICRGFLGKRITDGRQKPNLAAVSFSVSAERFSAASSRSDTGVLMREFTP